MTIAISARLRESVISNFYRSREEEQVNIWRPVEPGEILDEAVRQVPAEVKNQNPEIPWREMANI